MKESIWDCIDKSKVESKPHHILRVKKFLKTPKKKSKIKYIIHSKKRGIFHIPDNF